MFYEPFVEPMSLAFNKNGIWTLFDMQNIVLMTETPTIPIFFRLWKWVPFEVYTKKSDTSISTNYWRQFNNAFGAYTAKNILTKLLLVMYSYEVDMFRGKCRKTIQNCKL